MRSIAIREELTGEWKSRGVKEQKEYSILTAEISNATFGLAPSEYKKLKKLKNENLTDKTFVPAPEYEVYTKEIAKSVISE